MVTLGFIITFTTVHERGRGDEGRRGKRRGRYLSELAVSSLKYGCEGGGEWGEGRGGGVDRVVMKRWLSNADPALDSVKTENNISF